MICARAPQRKVLHLILVYGGSYSSVTSSGDSNTTDSVVTGTMSQTSG